MSQTKVVTAAPKDWKAAVTSGNWNTASNWVQGVIPAAGDTVSIGSFGDGVARTITYDYIGLAVTLNSLGIDLTGAGTAASTLSMSANNLISGSEFIGYNGRGTFNQSDGTHTINNDLRIGSQSGSTGTYNLSGPSSGSGTDLTVHGNQYIGDIGTGIFNHMGGGNHVDGNLYLGYNATGSGGTYTLSSGVVNVFGDEYVGYNGSGTFIHSGGSNNLYGFTRNLYVGYNAGATGTYTFSGGSFQTNSTRYIGYLVRPRREARERTGE